MKLNLVIIIFLSFFLSNCKKEKSDIAASTQEVEYISANLDSKKIKFEVKNYSYYDLAKKNLEINFYSKTDSVNFPKGILFGLFNLDLDKIKTPFIIDSNIRGVIEFPIAMQSTQPASFLSGRLNSSLTVLYVGKNAISGTFSGKIIEGNISYTGEYISCDFNCDTVPFTEGKFYFKYERK